jgi:FkbM family methyltransferase
MVRRVLTSARLAGFRQGVRETLLASSPGRRLLAGLTTAYARWRTGERVTVFFDAVWGHVVDGVRVPDSRKYFYTAAAIDRWVGEPARWLRVGRDFWCVKYQPRPGDIIIDVGAGMGSDAYFFSSVVGASGKVFAIEANPNTYVLLTKLCVWNGLRNVDCRQAAVVDSPRRVMIEDCDFHEANALVAAGSAAPAVSVQGVRLDDLVVAERLERIDFIKMNIEGAEALALEGMRQALKLSRHVCIACHDFRADLGEGENFRTRARVEQVLGELGFSLLPPDLARKPAIRDHVHGFRDV